MNTNNMVNSISYTDNELCDFLKSAKTIAVVGISSNPNKYGRIIAEFLKNAGYSVFGVNPFLKESGEIKIFSSLLEIPEDIDIVNVFRRSEYIPELIPDVIKKKPKLLWLQSGIRNDKAVQHAINAGIKVVQDTCIMVTHNRCF